MSILNCLLYYISYKDFDYFFSNHFSSDIKDWESIEATYQREGCRLFVATTKKAGNKVLAGCFGVKIPGEHIKMNAGSDLPENTYEICRVAVKPEFRRKGLSKLFFKSCEKYLKEQNQEFQGEKFNYILTTSELNKTARKVYIKNGFKTAKVINLYIFFGFLSLAFFMLLKQECK